MHLFDIEIRDTDPADLSLLLELRHCRPAFFKFGGVIDGPMNLVKINGINTQAPQAVFTLLANRISLQHIVNFPLPIPTQTTLREDIRTRTLPTRQRVGDDFFRVAGAIDRSSINPVDTQIESRFNRTYGFAFVLRPPVDAPTGR